MKSKQKNTVSSLFLLLLPFAVSAEEPDPVFPSGILDEGTLLFESRLRYEYADTDGSRASNAFTLRTRVGYETADWNGFSGLLEFSNLEALGNRDNYNAAGTNPGAGDRTIVADVPGTEVNRAALTFTQNAFTAAIGRQRVILDNARFVGNVGWRQREQTFDALTLRLDNVNDFSLFYAYVDRVNRIFGPRHPAGRFDSESHLVNASYAGLPVGKIGAYGYLLRFDDDAAASSDTAGLYWTGDYEWNEDWTVAGHLEYARQTDNGSSPANGDFSNDYFRAQASTTYRVTTFGAGWETLGSDGGERGFSTPLATLHAHNGWTDVFLATPEEGLRDFFIFLEQPLPGGVDGRLGFHDFRPDSGGGRYGREFNALAAKRWTPGWSTLAKFAHFEGASDNPDVTKGWIQAEYRY